MDTSSERKVRLALRQVPVDLDSSRSTLSDSESQGEVERDSATAVEDVDNLRKNAPPNDQRLSSASVSSGEDSLDGRLVFLVKPKICLVIALKSTQTWGKD